MPNIKTGHILRASPLLFGFPMVLGGYQILREWKSESAALIVTGALILLCGAVMMASLIWVLATLGRNRIPLWLGGLSSLVCGAVVLTSLLRHGLPCSGPD